MRGRLLLFYYLLFATGALLIANFQQYQNWDVIGYVASAKSFEVDDPEKLHRWVYDELRASVSPAEYRNMVAGEGLPDASQRAYRQAMGADASAFAEQLPFYQIRPLYNGVIYLLNKMGVNAFQAAHLMSGFSVFVALLLTLLIARPYLKTVHLYLLPVIFMAFGVYDLARIATPDALAFAIIFLSGYLYLRGHYRWLLVALVAAVMVRTDLIIFCGLFALLLFLSPEKRVKRLGLLAVVLGATVYLLINQWFGNYGWAAIFSFTLLGIQIHPATVQFHVSIAEYLHVLVHELLSLQGNSKFLFFFFFGCWSFYYFIKTRAWCAEAVQEQRLFHLLLLSLAYLVAHVLLFPAVWDRFFLPQYLMVSIIFMVLLQRGFPVHEATQSRRVEDV